MRRNPLMLFGAASLLLLVTGTPALAQAGQAEATPSPIVLVGSSNGSLPVASTGPSLDAVLTLRAPQAPQEVLVQISAFRSEDGSTSEATIEPERPEFRGRLTTVRVTASLSFGGPFRAELTISHDGVVDDPVVLTVTRTRAGTPLLVDSVQTSSRVTWGVFRQSIRHSVMISQTSGRRLELDPLQVVKPSGRYGDQVSAADVRVTNVGVADGDRCAVDTAWRITVEAGASCRISLILEAPAGAGGYEGALRFVAAGFAPVDNPMAIQLRRSWLVATLFIGAGILLAFLVKQVWRPRRERIAARIGIASAREDLDAAARRLPDGIQDPQEQAQVDGLHDVLDAADREVDDNRIAEATSRLAIAQKQIAALRPWVTLHRAFILADSDVQQGLKAQWDDITARMIDPALSADLAGGLLDELNSLREKLEKAELDRVHDLVEQFAQELPNLGLGPLEGQVRAEVDRAQAESTRDGGSADAAAKRLTTAQALAADVLAGRLEAFVSKDSSALGFPVTSEWWSVLRERVLRLVREAKQAPVVEKIRLLRQADAELLAGVAEQFRLMVSQRHAGASGPAPGNVAMRAALEPVLEHLERVGPAVQEGNLAQAHKAYQDAQESWKEAKTRPGVHMGPADQAVQPAGVPEAGLGPPAVAMVPGRLHKTPVRRSRDAFLAMQRQNEAAIAIVAGIVAIIAGIVALYVGKGTWGSIGDVVAAVLWGLGISAAADGVAGFAGAYETLTK